MIFVHAVQKIAHTINIGIIAQTAEQEWLVKVHLKKSQRRKIMAKLYDKIIHYDINGTRIDYTVDDLIRCGDCKNMEKRMFFGKQCYICNVFQIAVDLDGFCWKAKKS